VFDSNRLTDTSKVNSSELFVMSAENFEHPILDQEKQQQQQKHLTRGSSASWAPHGNRIAFHASQSGDGLASLPGPTPRILERLSQPDC
jgi:hypothetical protein